MINYAANYCGSYISLRFEAGRRYIHVPLLYIIRYIGEVERSASKLRHLLPFACRPFVELLRRGLPGIGEWIPGKLAEE